MSEDREEANVGDAKAARLAREMHVQQEQKQPGRPASLLERATARAYRAERESARYAELCRLLTLEVEATIRCLEIAVELGLVHLERTDRA